MKDSLTKEILNSSEFQRIFFFFTIYTPCTDLSYRGKSLESYGWNNQSELKKILLKDKTIELYSARNYKSMKEELQKADLQDFPPKSISAEKICIYINRSNQLMSIFSHIRNSFAHGRFNITDFNGEQFYIFEDVAEQKNPHITKISARLILRTSTLLKWIQIIEGGRKSYKKEV